MLAAAIEVAQSHEDPQRLIVHAAAAEGKKRLEYIVGLLPVLGHPSKLDAVLPGRVLEEQVAPDADAAGDVRLSAGLEAQARRQQQHVGIGAEDGAGRSGAGHAPSDRRVKSLQSFRRRQVVLHRSTIRERASK